MGRPKKDVASSDAKTVIKSKKKKAKSNADVPIDKPKKRKKRKSSKLNTADLLFDDEDNKKLLDTLKDKDKKSKKAIFEEEDEIEVAIIDEDLVEEEIDDGYDSEFIEDLNGELDESVVKKKTRKKPKKVENFFDEPETDSFDLDYDIEEPEGEW